MSAESSSLACNHCYEFYLIPTGCEEDRRPTVICAQGHVVCAKCVVVIKTKKINCPECQGQILETTRIDLKCMKNIETIFNQKNRKFTDLKLDKTPFARGGFADVY